MNRILFYIQYATRNLWRNRRWSAFAMLSVAAGVATVVALRSLGLAIGDSLTSNVRSSNHGDITLERGGGGGFAINLRGADDRNVFTQQQMNIIRDWVNRHNGQASEYTFTSLQVTAANRSGAGLLNFMSALFIDPQTYPPTQDIFAADPAGVPLGALFQGGNEVVISENLAEAQGLQVGDLVRVSGTDETYVVRGIVPTESEAGLRNLFGAFFGFVYFDRAQTDQLGISPQPNRVSIALPLGTPLEEISAAGTEIGRLLNNAGGVSSVITVPRLIEQNATIADIVGRFIVVMGLGAMLIGGVGIINTMLVMVRRRTEEIAALKTFGLKGRQVALLFMTEALLLGFVGSVAGTIAGSLLSRLTNAYGETFIQQPLVWQIYPEALVFGLVLGLVVTGVFGVMPVLTAVKVRPGIILRPYQTHIPALGVLQSLGVLLFVVLSLGIIAGQIVGPLPEWTRTPFNLPIPPHIAFGIIGVTATLALLGILVGILWIVVWIVGKFPSFGWIDLRLALTNLRSRRLRTATTLLAISIGMFALSSITFYGASVREILQFTLSNTFGGNVMIISPATTGIPILGENAQRLLDRRLDELAGVTYRTRLMGYSGEFTRVDGTTFEVTRGGMTEREFQQAMQRAAREGDFDRMEELSQQMGPLFNRRVNIAVYDTDNPNITQAELLEGRYLSLEDRGRPVAVISSGGRGLLEQFNIQLGSQVTLQIENRTVTVEIVGILAESSQMFSANFGDMQLPPDNLGNLRPNFQLNTIQVEPAEMDQVLLGISSMPGFFPLNITFIDNVLSRFIEQFSALPILVGLLSLGAAAVIMANTVALATLERRKQIGILKAIGLKSRRVLSIMLLENTLVSLLGGVIGIGLSALGVAALSTFGLEELVLIPRDAQQVAFALIIAAVLIGGVSTFLSANVAVRERVLNVLRYE